LIAASETEARIPAMEHRATPRISPLDPPYDAELARTLERMMGGSAVEPLKLFRTVAHNRHVLDKLRSTGSYLLNFGTVAPLDREVVIHRTCARCGAEYEWGVHVAVFGRPLGLSEEQVAATVHGGPDADVWDERQSLLVRLADELHDAATISDELWGSLVRHWNEAQLVELVALAGQYHAVSFLANGLRVELEEFAPRWPGAART
jgi:alkylhydroperoxidase family enzyme